MVAHTGRLLNMSSPTGRRARPGNLSVTPAVRRAASKPSYRLQLSPCSSVLPLRVSPVARVSARTVAPVEIKPRARPM